MTWEELKDEPSDDLIEYIKCKEQPDYKELAEQAFIALTFRFRVEVIDRCRRLANKWGYDNDTGDLIANRTFERFWKYPYKFQKGNCKKLDINKCVKLYLFRIAQRQLTDYSNEIAGLNATPYDGTEDIIVEFPDLDKMEFPAEKVKELKRVQELIEKALQRLTWKHKIIYLTYNAHKEKGYKLPRPLLKKLREELELSQASIQVYKKQAIDTIKDFLDLYGNK